MTSGVKNCTPRARLSADPMAAFRMDVGNSSEKNGPKLDQVPVPIPSSAMAARSIGVE